MTKGNTSSLGWAYVRLTDSSELECVRSLYKLLPVTFEAEKQTNNRATALLILKQQTLPTTEASAFTHWTQSLMVQAAPLPVHGMHKDRLATASIEQL